MLYDVIEDAADRRIKFAVERVDTAKLEEKNPLVSDEALRSFFNINFLREMLSSLFKIFNTDLAAGAEGVPCHMVKCDDCSKLP